MIQPTARKLQKALSDMDGIFRRLSVALRGVADFKIFFSALQETFVWLSHVSGREIRFDLPDGPGGAPDDLFGQPQLTAPVDAGGTPGGFVRVAPPGGSRPFGPQDLHLLGSVAEFTSALLELSKNVRDHRRIQELLRFVYDQLPIGLVCFDGDGEVLIRNTRVLNVADAEVWSDQGRAIGYLEQFGSRRSTEDPTHLQYVIPSGAKQLLVDVRRFERSGQGLYTIATFGDLVSDERTVQVALTREVYRCRWLARPLTLVVLRSTVDPARLPALIPDILDRFGSDVVSDMVDESLLGLVMPGREAREALRLVRSLPGLAGVESLGVGWTSLGPGGSPDELLQQAVDEIRPADALLAPRLLVFDGYGAIIDTIEMVVRDRFRIDKTTDLVDAERLLETCPYDGLVAEWEPDERNRESRLLETATRLQPGIRTVVTTTRFDLRSEDLPGSLDTRIVIKPFTVEGLRAALDNLSPLNPAC